MYIGRVNLECALVQNFYSRKLIYTRRPLTKQPIVKLKLTPFTSQKKIIFLQKIINSFFCGLGLEERASAVSDIPWCRIWP